MTTPNPELTAANIGGAEVDVLFYLHTGDAWPSYPSETVRARFVTPHIIEVLTTPRYAYGFSRGDLAAVSHDGFGYFGRHVTTFVGRSTARVVATTTDELEPIADIMRSAGIGVELIAAVAMLVLDIPETVDLRIVESLLDGRVSMTCNYEISSTPAGVVR